MKMILALALLLVSLGLSDGVARAEGATTSFALIVTNNRSVRLSRPDLRYADDDGAKYYDVFRMVAPEANVALLTTFDRDTEKLFSHLVGKAKTPSRPQIQAAVKDFVEKVSVAKQRGPVDFYFVFAGHGDIDKGKGFVELSDGPFTSDDLEAMLNAIPATRAHVILDSCNSFFVINSRKPGGQHFVTSEQAAKSLSARLPNVGVFLSTSAEAETFEWSELQSGVFSHAVRSGLSGAADANGDGQVSYDELRAFVNIATKDVKNPNYRPQVFARGPGGRGGDAVLDLTKAHATRVQIDEAEHRLTVRDDNEVPWIDLHKEAGKNLTVHIPVRLAAVATLDEIDRSTGRVRRRHNLPPADPSTETLLASLASTEPTTDTRGPDDIFRVLFLHPFGSEAFAQHQRESAKEIPVVFGVSDDDKTRMHDLLEQAAERARTQRHLGGLALGGVGVLIGATGAYAYSQSWNATQRTFSVGVSAVGGGLVLGGLFAGLVSSREEDIFGTYVVGMDRSSDPARVAFDTEEQLFELARRHRTARMWMRGLGIGTGVLGAGVAAWGVVASRSSNERFAAAMLGGSILLESGVVIGVTYIKHPTEMMAELWSKDPGLQRLPRSEKGWMMVNVRPQIGFGTLSLSGTF